MAYLLLILKVKIKKVIDSYINNIYFYINIQKLLLKDIKKDLKIKQHLNIL